MNVLKTLASSLVLAGFAAAPALADTATYLKTDIDASIRDGNRQDSIILQERIGFTNGTLWAEFGVGGDVSTEEAVISAEVGVSKALSKNLDLIITVEPYYFVEADEVDFNVDASLYYWF